MKIGYIYRIWRGDMSYVGETAWLHGETAQSSTASYTLVGQLKCRFELSRWSQHNPCARY